MMATPGSLDDHVTSAVKSCVVPSVMVPVAVKVTSCPGALSVGACGKSESAANSAGVIVTVALALPPFRVAVIDACPTPFEATGKSTDVVPAGMLTIWGTDATSGALETSVTATGRLGARETDTVSVPGVPFASVSAAGARPVTTGGGGLTSTRARALEPLI